MTEKDYSRENEILLERWRREQDRTKSIAEHMEKVTKETIAKRLKQEGIRSDVARDLRKALKNTEKLPFKEGFGGTDPLETGFDNKYTID